MMESLVKIKEYLLSNKEWLFSGTGVSITVAIFTSIVIIFKKTLFKNKKFEIDYIETKANHLIRKESIAIYSPRSEFDDYLSFVVNQAKKNITLVSITFGFVSYPKLEKLVEENNIVFNFYILDPKSQYFKARIDDISLKASKNSDYLFKNDVDNLIRLKEKFSSKINIYQYDNYPFWHYILIDNKKIYLSYHPINSLGYNKCNLFEVEKKTSIDMFKLFTSHIDIIKKESRKL